MSDKIKDGGPAFPVSTSEASEGHQDGPNTWQFPGMTLRDYFAAKAMQSYFTDPDVGVGGDVIADGAHIAYRIADAMIKAREAKVQDATGTLMERIAALEDQKKSFADLSFRQVGKLQSLIKEREAERDRLRGLLVQQEYICRNQADLLRKSVRGNTAALNEFSAVEKEAESVIAAAESALKAEDDKP